MNIVLLANVWRVLKIVHNGRLKMVRLNKSFVMGLLVSFGLVMSASAQQFSKAEDAIKYRKSALFVIGTQFSQIGAMVQGKAPYDAKVAADSATVVEVMAKLPWTAFGEGTDKGETKAKSEIWTDSAKFKEAQEKFIAESAKLASASKSGKLEDLKVAFAATGGTCKNCHDSFRSK